MAAFLDATVRLLTLLSGLPVLGLGVLLLFLRPSRAPNRFFAAFAIAWGLQIVTANWAALVDDARLFTALYRATLVLYLVCALFLLHFTALHPVRTRAGHFPWSLLPVLVPLPGILVLVFVPDAVFTTVTFEGQPAASFGDLAQPLFFLPFFGAFYAALVVQYVALRRSAGPVARDRARMVFIALSLFVAYATVQNFLLSAWPTAHEEAQSTLVLFSTAGLFAVGMLILAGLALHASLRPVRAHDRDVALLAALLVPAAFAVAERLLAEAGIGLETGWLWRILAVALLVYAIARYQLFDLEVRARALLVPAFPAAVAIMAFALGLALDARFPGPWTRVGAGLFGLTVTAMAWAGRDRLAERFLLLGGRDESYLRHRRYEVYRGALESAQGEPDFDPRMLKRLRKALDITDREHEVLAYMVGQEVAGRGDQPETRAKPGALLHGRYKIDRLLGEGAHGRAYLAHDVATDAEVAVKVVGTALLGGRAAHTLQREARLLAGLDHPHVVRVHATHATPDEVHVVMEYADGGSLAQLLSRRRTLPTDEAVGLLDGILQGLAAAHREGIVHRDLKPSNILLTNTGEAKIADFGVARRAHDDATAMADGVAGTLLYMSPEQVRGVDADARSDLFAAAVVFHEMLTGAYYLKIAGRDDFQVRRLILEGTPQLAVAGLPAWIEPFLRRALAKDPAQRFTDAEAMRAGLPRAADPTTAALPRRTRRAA